ncbi:hypothetical protein MBR110_30055 (plasmid) [Burkholderia sp. MBR-1]|nr:hypothetical protein MBR110_30055 [Burkholderia sp. MBR-1]
MLAVLGALDSPDITHTLVQISAAVGLDKHTVTRMIKQAQEQAGVTIEKVGATYFIRDWGLAIRPEGARATLEAIFLSRREA